MNISRYTRYEIIEREAEKKQARQLSIIKRECCPNCVNRDKVNCLKLKHMLENSIEVYKCENYTKN